MYFVENKFHPKIANFRCCTQIVMIQLTRLYVFNFYLIDFWPTCIWYSRIFLGCQKVTKIKKSSFPSNILLQKMRGGEVNGGGQVASNVIKGNKCASPSLTSHICWGECFRGHVVRIASYTTMSLPTEK